MRGRGPGVWITGPSRSGTSLVAGLFAAHHVFFGRTIGGDAFNLKGYFEHPEIIRRIESRTSVDLSRWPLAWWETLEREGHIGGTHWGVKRGPRSWPLIKRLGPRLIVRCRRPRRQQIESRLRRWGNRDIDHRAAMEQAEADLDRILKNIGVPVVSVHTDKLILGNYRRIRKAFRLFGVSFNQKTAAQWIDPKLWHR